MSNQKIFLILVASLVLITSWFIFRKVNATSILQLGTLDVTQKAVTKAKASHPYLFFDEKSFNQGVLQNSQVNQTANYHISGGIIPHHLLSGFILSDFFKRLSKQNPKTIIFVGPNHYEKGNFKVLSSLYNWDTPFGIVESDDAIIQDLLSQKLLQIDEDVLVKDHSVAGLMPYVKYYLPGTKVVPILLSARTNLSEIMIFVNHLKQHLNKDTVIIAPVDFSHYLTNKQAQEKDRISFRAIQNFDYRQIMSFNNDYLDSPPSITTLLMLMQELGTTNLDLLHHTNSGELQKNDFIETTSYFSIAYY